MGLALFSTSPNPIYFPLLFVLAAPSVQVTLEQCLNYVDIDLSSSHLCCSRVTLLLGSAYAEGPPWLLYVDFQQPFRSVPQPLCCVRVTCIIVQDMSQSKKTTEKVEDTARGTFSHFISFKNSSSINPVRGEE